MSEAPDWRELQKIPLFSHLSEQEIYQVAKLSFVKPYKKETTLFVEGMPGEVLYVVLRGGVEVFKKSPKGEMVIAELGAGDFVGEMSLIDDGPRSASARVSEDSELLVVTRKCFKDMMQSDPRISAKLLMQFLLISNSRLRQADKRFELF